MSWHFSQGLVAAYLADNCTDGEPYAEWKSIPSASDDSCSDKLKGTFHSSPFGTMYVPLTDALGKKLLTLSRAASHVNLSQMLPTDTPRRWTFGQKCFASLQKSILSLCSLRMLSYPPLQEPQKIAKKSVIKPKSPLFQRKTWVLTTLGKDTGFLHTPTCTANYTAPSMMKHKCCQIFVQAFGKARNPWVAEWLMGWPMGWTDSAPLATDKFQQWQRQHGQS